MSVNIENFNTNRTFLDYPLETYDIIAIQEHWVYKSIISCCDYKEPITSLQRPRGKGGVALAWRKT